MISCIYLFEEEPCLVPTEFAALHLGHLSAAFANAAAVFMA
jgi:hypothetical protein